MTAAGWTTTPNGRFQQCRIDQLAGPLAEALAWLIMQSSDRRAFVVVECIEVHVNDETGKRWTVERFVQFCSVNEPGWLLFDMPIGQLTDDEQVRLPRSLGDRVETTLVDEETGEEQFPPLVCISKRVSESLEGVRLARLALQQVMQFPDDRVVTVSMQEGEPGGQN